MQNVQNMQNILLLTERTSALWAVYGYFFLPLRQFNTHNDASKQKMVAFQQLMVETGIGEEYWFGDNSSDIDSSCSVLR